MNMLLKGNFPIVYTHTHTKNKIHIIQTGFVKDHRIFLYDFQV